MTASTSRASSSHASYRIGLPRCEHWRIQTEELDVVLHRLEKAIRLLVKSTPNIVGLLCHTFWAPPPSSDRTFPVTALVAYALLAGTAWWLEDRRHADHAA